MRRAERLFEIIQTLRRARTPLTGEAIARELETSRRTIYRDVAALTAQRVPIRGEAGVGYVLDKSFHLPPLMLTSDELEAVVLGAQWVQHHGDVALARADADVVAKVAAITPKALQSLIDDPAVATPPSPPVGAVRVDVGLLRAWSQQGRTLNLRYADADNRVTTRTVWPFLVGYHEAVQVVIAWCELRDDFRMFRTDRIASAEFVEARYPERPVVLRRRWLAREAVRTRAK